MLGRLAEVFPDVPRLAVTATADARTREDIRAELRLGDAREFVDSFARPELQLSAERKRGDGHGRVLELVAERPGRSGVVYAGSRDGTDKLAEALATPGVPALAYHAGLDKDVRAHRLEQFLEADARGDGGDHRLRHGRRQAGRPLRHPRRSAGLHRGLLAGDRPRRPRRRAGRGHHPLCRLRPRLGAAPHRRARAWTPRSSQVQMRKVRQLYAMLDGIGCRAAAVRRYFGESGVEPCGQCDLCLSPPRGGRRHRGRAEGALGRAPPGRPVRPRARRRPPARQDQGGQRPPRRACPPTASAASSARRGWRDLLDQLLFEGLLREDPNDGRPLIGLGDADAVQAVYRGERRVPVRRCLPRRGAAGRASRRAQAPRAASGRGRAPDDRRCSRRCAPGAGSSAAEQHVPPYVIFHDATLAEIARRAAGEPRRPWRTSAASARASSSATARRCCALVRDN